MDNIKVELVNNIISVCTKTQHNLPKLKQLSLKMAEINFTNTNVSFNEALTILELLYASNSFKNLEFVFVDEMGLFTYTPKTQKPPKVLQKLNYCVNASFSIYLYV